MDQGALPPGVAEQLPAEGSAGAARGVSAELLAIGARLRAARERRSLALEDLENGTHIRQSYLRALEEGRAGDLPGDVFVKGFIRTYGNHIGLDGPGLVEEYKQALRLREAQVQAAAYRRAQPRHRPGEPAPQRGAGGTARPARRRRRSGEGAWVWVLALALAAAAYGVIRLAARPAAAPARRAPTSAAASGPSAAAHPSAAAASSAAAAPPSASGASSAAPAAPQVAAAFVHTAQGWEGTYTVTGASGLQVTFAAHAYCWTARWADGSADPQQYRLAYTGPETVTWTAQHSLRVQLGNAAGITSITVDGQPTPALPPQPPDDAEFLLFELA